MSIAPKTKSAAAKRREDGKHAKAMRGETNPSTGHSLINKRVVAYASGSGSISFTWQGTDAKLGSVIAFKSPTAEEIMAANVLRPGWKLVLIDGQVQAVGPVKRINEHVLELPPEPYREYNSRFAYDPDKPGHVEFQVLEPTPPTGRQQLNNISILSRLRFFLKHEEEIHKQLAQ
jgi:hypothetical protein